MLAKEAIIVQSDLSILLDSRSIYAVEVQKQIQPFAELIKVMGQYEVYEVTAITLWNALTLGMKSERILDILHMYVKGTVPILAEQKLQLWLNRFGRLQLQYMDQQLVLQGDAEIMCELAQHNLIIDWIVSKVSDTDWLLKRDSRGFVKQELARSGYAVTDLVGYHEGETVSLQLREKTSKGQTFQLRDYQRKAIAAFHRDKLGGSGVIVLPCGTGKTITGIGIIASLQAATLIVTSSITSANQWRQELIEKTDIDATRIGIYGGKQREVLEITIATYTILTHRQPSSDQYLHMKLFSERDWGLIIYDEVQLLPAPIFRMTATIQATRRLGLTATLIREDGCAHDVFSLVGPKLFDMQWKKAEEQSYIAKVHCTEIRVSLATEQRETYRHAPPRTRLRIAAVNSNKLTIVKELLQQHRDKPTLIIGQYITQLEEIAQELSVPMLSGTTKQVDREAFYAKFRSGECPILIVSRIANLAVDLPDACVAIQVSGSFGSRQEEAQRIGRLLRPKKTLNEAWFYTLVTEETKETEFALKRGMFMLEQGYQYQCISQHEVLSE